MRLTAFVDGKRLGGLATGLGRRLEQVVRAEALAIVREAQTRAPVDTGALRASIYPVFYGKSGASKAEAAASTLRPGVGFLPAPRPESPFEAYVAVGVNYGEPVEVGTEKRPPSPFMEPSLVARRPHFLRAVRRAVMEAAGGR